MSYGERIRLILSHKAIPCLHIKLIYLFILFFQLSERIFLRDVLSNLWCGYHTRMTH